MTQYTVSNPSDMHPLNREFAELAADMRERGFEWEAIAKYAKITAENTETASHL